MMITDYLQRDNEILRLSLDAANKRVERWRQRYLDTLKELEELRKEKTHE